METTIKTRQFERELLLSLAILTLSIAVVRSVPVPRFLPASRIEEGEIVVRDDSVTTIVIPDLR